MPSTLNDQQRVLTSGKHLQQSTEYKKIPTNAEWDNIVKLGNIGFFKFKGEFSKEIRRLVQLGFKPKTKDVASGPHLTDTTLVGSAISRYNLGAENHHTEDVLDVSIRSSLIIDIYSLTGRFMRSTLRDDNRTDYDCQFFAAYRGVHFAAADELAKLHNIPSDQVDIMLQRQMIGLSKHGKDIDDSLVNKKNKLIYLRDAQVLAYRIDIINGKLYSKNPMDGKAVAFDTKKWTRGLDFGNSCHLA